jgi:hypothetical protein
MWMTLGYWRKSQLQRLSIMDFDPKTKPSEDLSATSISFERWHTHPVSGNKAPAMRAPNDTDVVNPALTSPMYKPLFFFPANSRTRMKEMVMIPAPPIPWMALPRRNTFTSLAWDVTIPPTAKKRDPAKIQFLGEKIWASLAASGEVLDIAIYIYVKRIPFRVKGLYIPNIQK